MFAVCAFNSCIATMLISRLKHEEKCYIIVKPLGGSIKYFSVMTQTFKTYLYLIE